MVILNFGILLNICISLDFCCLEHPLYQCQDRDPTVIAQNSPSKEGDDRASLTLPGFLYIHNSIIPNAGKGNF